VCVRVDACQCVGRECPPPFAWVSTTMYTEKMKAPRRRVDRVSGSAHMHAERVCGGASARSGAPRAPHLAVEPDLHEAKHDEDQRSE